MIICVPFFEKFWMYLKKKNLKENPKEVAVCA